MIYKDALNIKMKDIVLLKDGQLRTVKKKMIIKSFGNRKKMWFILSPNYLCDNKSIKCIVKNIEVENE